jgi:hypothetical protein
VSAVETARQLTSERPAHPVVSLYLDLDPERFATAPARVSQVRSLIDGATREVENDRALTHEERIALREDLERMRSYLLSREPPFRGARGLAVFCSARDDLFEVVQMRGPVDARVMIERMPYVEPLIRAADTRNWCVALVSRRKAWILGGPADGLRERGRIEDTVHGQHDQGGWSQANYERSVEKDVDDHLRRVAELLYRRWRREHFDRLVLGGPIEISSRLEGFLQDDVRARLLPQRIDVDISSASEDQIRGAVMMLVEEDRREHERDALNRLADGIGHSSRGAGGPQDTVEALNERRVETLLLEGGFRRAGSRCPACGLLRAEVEGRCPADGTEVEKVEDLREAAVEAALAQDAEVLTVTHYGDLGPFQGIGAILRY